MNLLMKPFAPLISGLTVCAMTRILRRQFKLFSYSIVALLFSVTFSSGAMAAQPKECAEILSPDLVKLLAEKFPDYRVPQLVDLEQQYIDFELSEGRNGCYAVAQGDFNGDHRQDFAIWLTAAKGKSLRLVVALQQEKSWTVDELPSFCENVKYCYVKPEKPGTYVRTNALDSPPTRRDERVKLRSKTTSVMAGKWESTGIVYVYSEGHWNYVWVSD